MEPIRLLEIYKEIWIADFLRYFIPTGTAFLLVWVLFKNRLSHRFIQIGRPKSFRFWFEFKYSMSTVLIFALNGLGIVLAHKYGVFTIYEDIATYGWGYFFLSLGIMLVFHDAYFYWTHRWMHHPRIFKYVHKVHHLSHNPSPWAAYSFHPFEAVVQALVLPIMLLFLPLHPLTIFMFLVYMILKNVLGHLGYELFPRSFIKNKWFNWHTSTTHHSMHHQFSKGNYGLYFTWWDQLMKTTNGKYHESFEEVTSRPKHSVSKPGVKVVIVLFGLSLALNAQSPEGQWMTFNESTNDPLSIISIQYNVQLAAMEGVIDSVIMPPHQGEYARCVKCPGNKKDQPLVGLEFVWGFTLAGDTWINGKILDPESGIIYHSKIWFQDEDHIKVRGYGGLFNLFYRTQIWRRMKGTGIEGLWEVTDERFNSVRAHVFLKIHQGELKGRIKQTFLLPHEGNNPICIQCEGQLKNQPIVGMQLMSGFKINQDKWINGEIMDPGNGKYYRSNFWLKDDNTLIIRGYWGPFFRTQVWKRLNSTSAKFFRNDDIEKNQVTFLQNGQRVSKTSKDEH